MEYTALLAGRRSTRHFDTSREVPDGVLAAPLAMPHAGIEAARLLLLREAAAGVRKHVVLVSDAECTSHNGTDEAWGPLGAPIGSQLIPWLMSGGVVDVARRAALIAASRCRRQGITVSVAYPDLRAEVDFAHQLAETGGGRARCLRVSA